MFASARRRRRATNASLVAILTLFLVGSIGQPFMIMANAAPAPDPDARSYSESLDYVPEADPLSVRIQEALDLAQPGGVGVGGPSAPGWAGRPDPMAALTGGASGGSAGGNSNLEQVLALSQELNDASYREAVDEPGIVRFAKMVGGGVSRAASTAFSFLNPFDGGDDPVKARADTGALPPADEPTLNPRAESLTGPGISVDIDALVDPFAGPGAPPSEPSEQPGSATLATPPSAPVSLLGTHTCTIPASPPAPATVGYDSAAIHQFQNAYCDNGLDGLTVPSATVAVDGDLRIQQLANGGALVFDAVGSVTGEAFYLPPFINDVFAIQKSFLGAPVADLDPQAPPFYNDGNVDFTAFPYQRFERGFVGRDASVGSVYTANKYFPVITNVSAKAVPAWPDWRLEITASLNGFPRYAGATTTLDDPAMALQVWRSNGDDLGVELLPLFSSSGNDYTYKGSSPWTCSRVSRSRSR